MKVYHRLVAAAVIVVVTVAGDATYNSKLRDRRQDANRKLDATFALRRSLDATRSPKCGTIQNEDGLILGPYERPSAEMDPTDYCANDEAKNNWFSNKYYRPNNQFVFTLRGNCEYAYSSPATFLEHTAIEQGGVNAWFDLAAESFRRPGHVAYKVNENVQFSGYDVPVRGDLILDVQDCPEEYCVKITGPAAGYVPGGANDDAAELVWAFSNKDAEYDFRLMVEDAINSKYREKIFKTNHFLQCGCESFCWNAPEYPSSKATCYVEEMCGVRVFKIAYEDSYPDQDKPEWHEHGTTEVMEWFDYCSRAQYGCTLVEEMSAKSLFEGSGWAHDSKRFPEVWESDDPDLGHLYQLGGMKEEGFPTARKNEGHITWKCPNLDARTNLKDWGERVKVKSFMRDSGIGLNVPDLPCEPEVINLPEYSEIPPAIGPDCGDIDHSGFCMQLPGGTCYIRDPIENCMEVDFVVQTDTKLEVFSDVQEWHKICVEYGTGCLKQPTPSGKEPGVFTNIGAPGSSVYYDSTIGWYLQVYNEKKNRENTFTGWPLEFHCDVWDLAYSAQNVSKFSSFLLLFFIRMFLFSLLVQYSLWHNLLYYI